MQLTFISYHFSFRSVVFFVFFSDVLHMFYCNSKDRPPDQSVYLKISYFSTKTYALSTQKSRLNETVLLSTQNTCLTERWENNSNFNLELFGYRTIC